MERTKGRGDARQKNPERGRMLPWDRQHLAGYTGLDTQALDSIPQPAQLLCAPKESQDRFQVVEGTVRMFGGGGSTVSQRLR